jgi:hypothetical protein
VREEQIKKLIDGLKSRGLEYRCPFGWWNFNDDEIKVIIEGLQELIYKQVNKKARVTE